MTFAFEALEDDARNRILNLEQEIASLAEVHEPQWQGVVAFFQSELEDEQIYLERLRRLYSVRKKVN